MKVKFQLASRSFLIASALSACSTVPSSGPSTSRVAGLQNQQTAANVPQVAVVEVNEQVASALYRERVEQSLA